MVPPNQKPNTLYSAFILGGTVCNGKVLSGTHGPQKTKARPRMQRCGARGLMSQTSISVFIHAAIFVWTRRSLRGLSDFCPPPPTLCFCQQEKKTAKVKPSQSTSDQCSAPFLSLFSSDSGCPLAPVARFPRRLIPM